MRLIRSLWIKKIIIYISIVLLMSLAIAAADEEEVNLTVNAPEYVTDRFEVTIDISEVTDLNGGQFDLIFDSDVIEFQNVEPGDIDGTEIPIVGKNLFDEGDRIRVVIKLKGADGVSGSGYLAKIIFEVMGKTGDTTDFTIPDETLCETREELKPPKLSDTSADSILANWTGDKVTIGTLTSSSITDTPGVAVTSTPEPIAASGGITTNDPGPSTSEDQQDKPIAAVPDETIRSNDYKSDIQELLDLLTSDNFIIIYSCIGLLAFVYSLTLIEV